MFADAESRGGWVMRTEQQRHLTSVRADPTTYDTVRGHTEDLAAPLGPEDQVVQSMPDCSPTKWHRAHTTWFFETFVLSELDDYTPVDPSYAYLFNSYYEAAGPRHARPHRGLITAPDGRRGHPVPGTRRCRDATAPRRSRLAVQ